MSNPIFVVGIGPGRGGMMTPDARDAIAESDVVVGYTVYAELVRTVFPDKDFYTTPMRREMERCRKCFELAAQGRSVALVCSGDPGVYGMAAPMLMLQPEYPDTEIVVVPGITAANSGAALLGAPLNHDYCVISLSDLLTPWEVIENRIRCAIRGDFAIAVYNPSSRKRRDHLRRAVDIMLEEGASPDRACGLAENIGREGTRTLTCTLRELRDQEVNMFTTVFIGNSASCIQGGRLITKRGYERNHRTTQAQQS